MVWKGKVVLGLVLASLTGIAAVRPGVTCDLSGGRMLRPATGRIWHSLCLSFCSNVDSHFISQPQPNGSCSHLGDKPMTPSLAEIPTTHPRIPNELTMVHHPYVAPYGQSPSNLLHKIATSTKPTLRPRILVSSLHALFTSLPLPPFRPWPQQQLVASEPARPTAADCTGDLISNATTSSISTDSRAFRGSLRNLVCNPNSVFELGMWRGGVVYVYRLDGWSRMYTQDKKGERAKWAAVASQARERRRKGKVGHGCPRSTQGNRGGELAIVAGILYARTRG